MDWYNEPTSWHVEGNLIEVNADPGSDFWRRTHYGFIRDNGHFYYESVDDDFEAQVKVIGDYRDLYDQAGLMVRVGPEHWIKTGIEFVHGMQNLSAVVTREFSDWSVAPLPQNPQAIWLRLTRTAETVEIYYALDGAAYHLLRIAYLPPTERCQIGIMCAAPDGGGFSTRFEDFTIRPLTP